MVKQTGYSHVDVLNLLVSAEIAKFVKNIHDVFVKDIRDDDGFLKKPIYMPSGDIRVLLFQVVVWRHCVALRVIQLSDRGITLGCHLADVQVGAQSHRLTSCRIAFENAIHFQQKSIDAWAEWLTGQGSLYTEGSDAFVDFQAIANMVKIVKTRQEEFGDEQMFAV